MRTLMKSSSTVCFMIGIVTFADALDEFSLYKRVFGEILGLWKNFCVEIFGAKYWSAVLFCCAEVRVYSIFGLISI